MSEREYGLETVSEDREWIPLSCTSIDGHDLCIEVADDGTIRYTIGDEPIETVDLEGVDGDLD